MTDPEEMRRTIIGALHCHHVGDLDGMRHLIAGVEIHEFAEALVSWTDVSMCRDAFMSEPEVWQKRLELWLRDLS